MPDEKGRFRKGEGGRPKGCKNKSTLLVAKQMVEVAEVQKTPLGVMLDVMNYYHRQWQGLKDSADRRFAAELTLSAARQAAPYCHARKVIIEEETTPVINVIDKREMGQMLTVNGSNGHGNGSNGSGRGSNGSNGGGHGSNGSNGSHGGNGHANGGSETVN
jgi:uncharacterized membrane protein YgcG